MKTGSETVREIGYHEIYLCIIVNIIATVVITVLLIIIIIQYYCYDLLLLPLITITVLLLDYFATANIVNYLLSFSGCARSERGRCGFHKCGLVWGWGGSSRGGPPVLLCLPGPQGQEETCRYHYLSWWR